MKVATIILIILALGLGGLLFYQHTQRVREKRSDEASINVFSNKLDKTTQDLQEQRDVNDRLTETLKHREKDLTEFSNKVVKVSADLDLEKQNAAAVAAALEKAKIEMAKKEKQINDLMTKETEYTKKMNNLNINIEELNKQINDTQKKLAASEGDRDFLLKELKRLQAEKAELERQFNDLSVLRTQVAKLKDELSIARRLEWIRMGIYGSQEKKGAEILMTGSTPGRVPGYELNVELRQDGTGGIVPPKTNAPAPAPAPK